ncbi:MAG: FG-GAP-like repeat-containing protein [Reinekea sp.]
MSFFVDRHGDPYNISNGTKMVTTEGHLQGQFTVSQGGAATYSLPIDLVTGPGGLIPNVSVNYYSQSGNGLLGKGWSLSATEVISRCKPVGRAANAPAYNANDTLCLNGDELRKSHTYGGYAVYRKRIDDGTMVQATANGFTVYNEAGLIKEFNQQQLKSDSNSIVKAWYLSQVSQPGGASYTLRYYINNADGEVLLGRIIYGAHSVSFIYEQRPDRAFGYDSGGAKFSRTQRLRRIEVLGNGQDAGSYWFSYGYNARVDQSYLKHIQKCAETSCLAPLSFEWQVPSSTLFDGTSVKEDLNGNYDSKYAFGDVDGNGTTDIIGYNANSDNPNKRITVFKSARSSNIQVEGWGRVMGQWVDSEESSSSADLLVSDVDADGIDDIIWYDGDGVQAFASNGTYSVGKAAQKRDTWDYKNTTFADLNGDGISDLVHFNDKKSGRFAAYLGDGRGRFSGSPQFNKRNDESQFGFADINGDGKADVVMLQDDGYLEYRFSSNTRSGLSFTSDKTLPFSSGGADKYNLNTADINGDGLSDVIVTTKSNGTAKIYISRGRELSSPIVKKSLGPMTTASVCLKLTTHLHPCFRMLMVMVGPIWFLQVVIGPAKWMVTLGQEWLQPIWYLAPPGHCGEEQMTRPQRRWLTLMVMAVLILFVIKRTIGLCKYIRDTQRHYRLRRFTMDTVMQRR